MRIPECKHFDFAFDAYEGGRRTYCALHGVVPCERCKGNTCGDKSSTGQNKENDANEQ